MSAIIHTVYKGLTDLAGPVVPLILDRRTASGKEDPTRRGERLGRPSRDRPDGPVAWVHAASVGEALSVQSMIRRLIALHPHLTVLLTTGTVTSAALMRDRLPERALHQFVPLDRCTYVRSFLDHWRPDLVIWVESELWPNTLSEIRLRDIPAIMVNARMSDRSFRNWRRWPATIHRLLASFRLILPWNDDQAEKLRRLGAAGIGPAGNLKYSADPPAANAQALERLRQAIGDRPVWLAASTHEGEELLVAQTHRALAAQRPDLLSIVVPRHPSRGERIAGLLSDQGLPIGRRGAGELPTPGCATYLADTMGEMGLFLRVAPIALIGGSLIPHGGHNPIEAAQLDTAILYGPHMDNFVEITRELTAAKGAVLVADGRALTESLLGLFDDPDECRRLASAAKQVANGNRGVLDRAMTAMAPLLRDAGIDCTA